MRKVTAAQQAEWTPENVASVGRSVAIVTGIGILLGIFAIAANLYYVAAIIGGAILAIIVSWQFEAALVLYALVAFVPWGRTPDLAVGGSGVGKGVYVSEVMLGFLLAVWLGKYLMGVLPKGRIRSGFYIPITLYLAYSVLNVVHSYVFWDPHVSSRYQDIRVNIIELGIRMLSAGALVMFATSISNRKWLKWVTIAVFCPGLYNLFNTLIGSPIPFVAPWWPLVTLLPVCYCWALVLDSNSRSRARIIGATVVGIAIMIILIRSISWVSGWFGLICALSAVTLIRSSRIFVLCLLVTVVVTAVYWSFFHQNVVVASREEGDYDRFALARGAWKYATNFPLGVGLGNYRTYNSFYYGDKWGTTSYTSAHGTYSQHLSEMGLPGFVLFLMILIGGFRWLLTKYWSMQPGPSRTYLLAALGQMAGIACAAVAGDYLLPAYHNGGLTTFSATVYSWMIWGLAVAHVRLSKDQSDGPVNSDSKLEYSRSA